MNQGDDNKFIPMTSLASGKGKEVKSDVFYYTNQIVNIIMLGDPADGEWVLVDAGMPKSGTEILSVAEERFGAGNKPMAIVLTHGHFDHTGSIVYLLNKWSDVPVYAHLLEFPYLSGQQSYPEPDTSVEGGLLAKISSVYPNEPVNIEEYLYPLPDDGVVPGLPDWKWIPVPGHSPGQVALFREIDHTLISADAFITVRQDSFYKVLIQKEEVNGPPRYLTTDWEAAFNSVKKLQQLAPETVIPGHGQFMQEEELRAGLKNLVDNFSTAAVPAYGKFVNNEDRQK